MTSAEKNMIELLKALGLDKETTVGIVTLLNTKEKMKAMEDYLLEMWQNGKKKPTQQEVLKKVKEIVTEK